jgi:tetratricopeptide (TPR) repeat protein
MAQMTGRTLALAAVLVAAVAPVSSAQTLGPDPVIAAEIRTLQAAAARNPSDSSLLIRLSQAYAVANQPRAALEAAQGALALEPKNPEYLRARAILATWASFYGLARDSYKALAKLESADADVTLNYARVSAWAGDTDRAVGHYRKYLAIKPDEAGIWLELARTESWRGNHAVALRELNEYRSRFGESSQYLTELAGILAHAGRPSRAEALVASVLETMSANDQLNLTHTVALARQHRAREAFASFDLLRAGATDRSAVRAAERVLRAELASTAEPRVSAYSDSDHLSVQHFSPTVTLALSTGTRINGGWEQSRLAADAGSGLEQLDGSQTALVTRLSAGIQQKIARTSIGAQLGQATVDGRDRTEYWISAEARPIDTLWVAAARSDGLFTVSPRTVGLGMTQVVHRVQAQWGIGMRYYVAADALFQDLSDGNERHEITASARRAMARRAGLNLDLGVSAYRLEATHDFSNGYYDPRRYEFYAVNAYPYFKLHEDIGLGLTIAAGAQRETTSPSFNFGGTLAGEAAFGIYAPWLLKVNGSATINGRLESGAFRGYGASIALIRRF